MDWPETELSLRVERLATIHIMASSIPLPVHSYRFVLYELWGWKAQEPTLQEQNVSLQFNVIHNQYNLYATVISSSSCTVWCFSKKRCYVNRRALACNMSCYSAHCCLTALFGRRNDCHLHKFSATTFVCLPQERPMFPYEYLIMVGCSYEELSWFILKTPRNLQWYFSLNCKYEKSRRVICSM
jgi:hypothetical protein